MDIALPGVSGIEGMRRILSYARDARVLMYGMYEKRFSCGAHSTPVLRVLLEAIVTVAAGRRFLVPT